MLDERHFGAICISWSSTGEERAINILRELHAAEEELVGRAVVMSDGKAGTINRIDVDDLHGLRISISGMTANGRFLP